jgi:hypothetical protein
MGCLFAIFAGCFPRLATIFIWLARPTLFSNAFHGRWFLPILGIIFLPFTTLMYVILWSSTGLTAGDWFWLILAVLLDLTHYASAAAANRDRLPGYAAA